MWSVGSYSMSGREKEGNKERTVQGVCAVLPDMGQMEKERPESHEWALMFMLPV